MDNIITKLLIELTPFYIFCNGIYSIKFIANIPEILSKKMANKKQQIVLEKNLPNSLKPSLIIKKTWKLLILIQI